MTVRDLVSHQYNTYQNSYTNNMLAVSGQQQPSSVQTQQTKNSSRLNQVSRTNSDSLQFLNQYKSNMDGLKSAAGRIRSLSKDGVWSNLEISSSNESIVSDATKWGQVPQRAQYDIEVKQLAQRQISQISAPEAGFHDGSFQLQSKDSAGNSVTASIQIDTQGGTASSGDIMSSIANQINQYNHLGIRASLIKDDEGTVTSIRLEGEEPGEGRTFDINDVDSTVNSVIEQEAQNLIYTLNGEEFTSSSNHNIQIDPSGDNNKLRLNFDGVGRATIKADVDTDKLAKYTEKFVNTYNETIDFLVDNAHRGSGVSNTLDQLMQTLIDPDITAKIGLHFGEDGKISFEADEFQKAMEEDILKVYDVLADNYSVADSIYQKADKASNYSTASLLDKSQLNDNQGGTFVINNYYYISPRPFYPSFFYPSFFYPGSLFFNTKV